MVRPNHTRLTTVVRTPFQLRHDRVHLNALAVHTPNTLPTDWRLARNIWMNRTLRRFFKTSQAVLLVIGCMHAKANVHGEFVPKKSQWQGPRGLNIPDAKSKAVVLFLHGSMVEKIDDTCDPNGQTPGFSVPEVIKQLAGTEVAGLEVVVFAPCDGRATNFGEPIKIEQRVAAIEQTLGALSRAGVEPSQIFLMGQSAGGWAALLHQKRYPGSVNSVVAFAPAFAGKKQWRPDIWQRRHETQSAEIQSAARISALIFAFENDEYNTPDDLAFLTSIEGTTVLRMPDKTIAGVACEIPLFASSHGQVYRKCFGDTQAKVLLDYLRQRLQSAATAATEASTGGPMAD